MIKYTIVIPCYNNFKMMKMCLKSLEEQSFKDFEVIFVDDKSKDDLVEKLKDYKKTSNLNMTILENEENMGPGPSRNRGIENAKGKYITFLDADDYIANNTLELIDNVIETEHPDCIIFDYYFETLKKKRIYQKSYLKYEKGIVSVGDALVNSRGGTCCKMYLLDILKENDVKFPPIKRCEDMAFNKVAMSHCKKIYYLDEPLYYYISMATSIMNSEETLSIENSSKAIEIVEKELKDKYPNELETIFIKEYFYGILVTLVNLKKTTIEIKEHIENCENRYPSIYENKDIKYMSKFQRICLKLAQKRHITLLKLSVKFKECIKKYM